MDALDPSLDPANYPPSPDPSTLGAAPCSLTASNARCELVVAGAGLLPIGLDDEVRGFVRHTVLRLDEASVLATDTGQALLGYRALADGDLDTTLGPIPLNRLMAPRATTEVEVRVNLDPNEAISNGFDPMDFNVTVQHVTSVTVWDSLGDWHWVDVMYTHIAANEWLWNALVTAGDLNGDDSTERVVIGSGTLSFTAEGLLDRASSDVANVTFYGASLQRIAFDFGESTQFAGGSMNIEEHYNGFPSGAFIELSVDWVGYVWALYSNGERPYLGRLPLALFDAPQRLQPLGTDLWAETAASGPARPGLALSAGRGGLVSVNPTRDR